MSSNQTPVAAVDETFEQGLLRALNESGLSKEAQEIILSEIAVTPVDQLLQLVDLQG